MDLAWIELIRVGVGLGVLGRFSGSLWLRAPFSAFREKRGGCGPRTFTFCDHAALPRATASSTGTRAKAVVGLVACITLFMSAMRSSVAMSSACGCAVSGSVKKMMPPRSSSTICVPTCEPDYTRVSLG